MIIGTAGHIDHGKTSLVRALTGVDTDRLKEEKARGISIELGFAYLAREHGAPLGFIDVPGHEKFVHTMLAGASGIDFALLVVAADDGIMPQTREHLAIIDLLGVSHGVVALTKADRVSPERLAEVTGQIAAEIAGSHLAGAEIMPVSALTGEGIDALRGRLTATADRLAARSDAGLFRLAADRSFFLAGAGTVVTGTVLSGRVAVGDRVVVSPSGLEARVRAIHAQNRPATEGRAGDRCALNLAGDGVTKEAITRGDVVLDPALHAPAARIDVVVSLLASERKPLAQWLPVRFHHGAADIAGRIVPLDEEPVGPGCSGRVQIVLDAPVAAAVGDRFVIRDTTAQRTMGGGRILDLRAPARKRRTPARLAEIDALESHLDDAEGALAALLALPPHCLDLTAFARDRALSPARTEAIAAALSLQATDAAGAVHVMDPAGLARFRAGLVDTLAEFHAINPDLAGMGLERLRMQLADRLPAPVFRGFLREAVREGAVVVDGAWARLPGHEIRLTDEEERIWAAARPLLSDAERFRPPRVRDIAGMLAVEEAAVRRLMKRLGRLGKVDEIAHDHFFLRTTTGEIVEIMRRIAAGLPRGEFVAAQLRDELDNGRKVAIQILEFFDRHGLTLRRGDLRRLNPHRLDLFGTPADQGPSDMPSSGRESSPVGRPDFKSGRGREPVLGGFDSLSLPPLTGRG